MFHCSGSVVWTAHLQPLLTQHCSSHQTAYRTHALEVLAPALTSGRWMTANAWRGQIEITVHSAGPTLSILFCGVTLMSHTRGQHFLLFCLWSPTSTPPTVAAALLAEAQVTSAGIFCPPWGAPRSPCNPSHSCRFDTFLYKGNTSKEKNFCR